MLRSTCGSGARPCRTPVEYLLLQRRVGHLPRPGAHRPALGDVEMLESGPILPFENVLRHDVDADVVLVGHEKEETRRWNHEIHHHSIGVRRGRLRHRLLHVNAPFHLGAIITQGIQRIGDILGAERSAIAPFDAGPGLDRKLPEIRREREGFRQPHIRLVGERAVIGQRLIDQIGSILVVGTDAVGIPQIEIHPASVAAAGPDQRHGLVPRHLGRLRHRNAARPWRQRRQRAGGHPGLHDVTPPLLHTGGLPGHGVFLSPKSAHVSRGGCVQHLTGSLQGFFAITRGTNSRLAQRCGRAGLGAGRVDSVAGGEPAAGSAGKVRCRLCVHLARTGGRAAHSAPGSRHVSGPAGGTG
jgi:hypothetical protein